MITNKYRGYDGKDDWGTFFIVSNSRENMFDELEEYCLAHKDEKIYYYVNPVRPSKINLRPEYSMEIDINPTGIIMFSRRAYY
jgi:hypothetical protein